MNKKCLGCGAVLQDKDSNKIGFTKNTNNDLCERCFRIKNYGDYKKVDKTNEEFIEILKEIDKTNDLVLLLVDLFSFNKNIELITKYLNNDIILVLTKRDILPLSLNDDKLLNYTNKLNINTKGKIIISSKKNYNIDRLYNMIKTYKKTSNVYVVGYTNVGKSSLINKIIYNYSDLNSSITTSILPSTTIDTIKINLDDDLTLIDTPGILDKGNIFNYINELDLKKIMPNKEIKPITYQIKKKQYIYIENLVKIESSNNNLTLFFSNILKIERLFKDKKVNLKEHILNVEKDKDIVILGLGFIKVTKKETIKIWTIDKVDIYIRDSLI